MPPLVPFQVIRVSTSPDIQAQPIKIVKNARMKSVIKGVKISRSHHGKKSRQIVTKPIILESKTRNRIQQVYIGNSFDLAITCELRPLDDKGAI